MNDQSMKYTILVSGAGRGGTNLLAALFRELNLVQFSDLGEDRELFNKELPQNYGCKLAVDNRGFEQIFDYMSKYPFLNIFFSLRHPTDNALSKIVRGQSKSGGGDTTMEEVAPDGIPTGAVKSVRSSFRYYRQLKVEYPDRVFGIRMEDLITNLGFVTENILHKLGEDEFNYDITEIDLMRSSKNKWHKQRYNDQIDNSQINLFNNLETSFDGYFSDKTELVEYFHEELVHEIQLYKELTYD